MITTAFEMPAATEYRALKISAMPPAASRDCSSYLPNRFSLSATAMKVPCGR